MRKPSPKVIRSALIRWKTSKEYERYRDQEKVLRQLFQDLFPKNNSISAILLKVTALNQFYSTNIYDTYSMARHILELKIDKHLVRGDLTLIGEIAAIKLSRRKKKFYSFATKYCSHYFPECFPIYDSFVSKMLALYRKQFKFESFSQNGLKDYEKFKNVLTAFRGAFGLNRIPLKETDIFLWINGREKFSKWRKKSRT
jgi:hypothetical protein